MFILFVCSGAGWTADDVTYCTARGGRAQDAVHGGQGHVNLITRCLLPSLCLTERGPEG